MATFEKLILVTGGAGFIGSHVVRLFVTKYPQYKIFNLDKLTYAGNLETLAEAMKNPQFRFVKADICDREAVDYIDAHKNAGDPVVSFSALAAAMGLTSPSLAERRAVAMAWSGAYRQFAISSEPIDVWCTRTTPSSKRHLRLRSKNAAPLTSSAAPTVPCKASLTRRPANPSWLPTT